MSPIFGPSGIGGVLSVVNVKDATWGTRGDGTTDDTVAIQAAHDSVSAAGGGILYFPPGTYITQGIIWDSKVKGIGSGYESTILKLKANTPTSVGATGDVIVGRNFASLSSSTYGGSGAGTSVAGINSWGIRDLTIDGNAANQTSGQGGCGIRVYGYGYAIDGIRVRNCKAGAFISDWGTGSPASNAPDAMEAHIANSKFHECADGFVINGPHDSVISNCQSYGHTSGAIGFHVGPNALGTLITQCHPWAFSGAPMSVAYKLEAQTQIIGGVAEGFYTGGVGIMILANQCVVSGTNIYTSGTTTGIGIQLGATGTIAVQGCDLNFTGARCSEGPIDYQNGTYNRIRCEFFSPAVNLWKGKPGATDMLDCVNTGGGSSSNGSIFSPVPFYGGGIGVGPQIIIATKAGTPADADYLFTPANGTIAIDTTNSKIYARIGGTWKGVVVA